MKFTDNQKGASQMTLSGFLFVTTDYIFQTISHLVALPQFLFLRGIFISFNMYAIAKRSRQPFPRERKIVMLMMARGAAEVYVAFAFLTTLKNVSLSDATAINQTVPLVMTLAAYFIFGERFGLIRLTAILTGFVGVLLIIKPGFSDFNAYYLLNLSVVFAITLRDLLAKQIPSGVASSWVALTSVVMVFLASGVFSLFVDWKTLSFELGMVIILMAMLATFAHLLIVKAMRIGEVNVVATFRYTAIPFAVFFDLIFKQHPPDALALLGCVMVAGAGIVTLYRSDL